MMKWYVQELIFFQSILIVIIIFYKERKNINRIISLRKITNDNVNVICYNSKYVVTQFLRYTTQNDYNTLSPLHISTKDHDNIIDENNRIKSIEFERSVLIGTQDNTYD